MNKQTFTTWLNSTIQNMELTRRGILPKGSPTLGTKHCTHGVYGILIRA